MDISSKLPASSALPDAVFTDFSSLQALRDGGNSDSASSLTEEDQLEEAARQFSSIFLHMALKSMRDASFGGGILDSQQSEFYSCLLYTSPSPRDQRGSRMPSSA